MPDKISKLHRSWVMSRIPSKHTKPELVARSLLHHLGFRFTVNGPKNRQLPGKPDIVLPKQRAVVFVHGCFWHRHPNCKTATTPKTNKDYWLKKFARNVERDRQNIQALEDRGWQVVVIWECELKDLDTVASNLISRMPRSSKYDLPEELNDLALVAEQRSQYGH
jgi:DNA mismatch endonuclease (patch repair protein)